MNTYPNEEKIGNNWSFSFIGVSCSQQKIFCQKKWNPKYFGVHVICDCLKPKQYEPYYSISNYHSDLFCGRYLLLHQARPLNPTLMFNYKLNQLGSRNKYINSNIKLKFCKTNMNSNIKLQINCTKKPKK